MAQTDRISLSKMPRSGSRKGVNTEIVVILHDLAISTWSDHNLHDPGITLLEHLAYALSDLSYRLGFNMADLLAESGTSQETKAFFSAADILPQAPLSLLDYRKLLLDQPGVKNVWLKVPGKPMPALRLENRNGICALVVSKDYGDKDNLYLNGNYDVLIEPVDPDKPFYKGVLWTRLAANRNLCEDINLISVLQPENIVIHLKIETESHVLLDPLFNAIALDLREWVSPQIRFYSLQEMLQRGKQPDEIFQGPPLANGFLDDDELRKFEKRTALRASDILHRVMDLKEVKVVRQVEMGVMKTDGTASEMQAQYLSLRDDYAPRLKKLQVDFFVHGRQIKTITKEINADTFSDQGATEPEDNTSGTGLSTVKGRYRDPAHYYSVTHDFPLNYGIGPNGLPAGATAGRQAQAKQLKAYLALFEQILANHFAQLEHVKTLFAVGGQKWNSYATQQLGQPDGIPGFGQLLQNPVGHGIRISNGWETVTQKAERLLRLTKHLLARSAEDWPEPPNFEADTLPHPVPFPAPSGAGASSGNVVVTPGLPHLPEPPTTIPMPQLLPASIAEKISQQRRFLSNYGALGFGRGLAYNYKDPQGAHDPDNISGLEKRLSHLLGMPTFTADPYTLIEVEYYQEKDTDPLNEFRFRVLEKSTRKILLSSSMHYHDIGAARLELELVLERAKINSAYQLADTDEKIKRYYFNITRIDGEVIARRIEYFKTSQKRREAIEYLKKLCSGLQKTDCFYMLEHSLIGPRPRDVYAIFLPSWRILSETLSMRYYIDGNSIICYAENHGVRQNELVWITEPCDLAGSYVTDSGDWDIFEVKKKTMQHPGNWLYINLRPMNVGVNGREMVCYTDPGQFPQGDVVAIVEPAEWAGVYIIGQSNEAEGIFTVSADHELSDQPYQTTGKWWTPEGFWSMDCSIIGEELWCYIENGPKLKVSDSVWILGAPTEYMGVYLITRVGIDYFVVQTQKGQKSDNKQFKGRWWFPSDTSGMDYEVQGSYISCECNQNHQLHEGNGIWITAPHRYVGPASVFDLQSKSFTIKVPPMNFYGRWARRLNPDPWSLQLSFVLPNNSKNLNEKDLQYLHNYIEAAIKQDTPAHLTPYVHWLTPDKMARFEGNYLALREKLPKNLNYYREMAALNEILNISNVRLAPAPETYLAIKNQGDYIELPEGSIVPYSTDRSEFTICFWANVEKVSKNSAPFIYLKGSDGKDLIKIEFRPKGIIFRCGSVRLAMPVTMRNLYGQWAHWTFVTRWRKGLQPYIGIYVDGIERASRPDTSPITESPVVNKILIGNWDESNKETTAISLADLRIWNLTLPDSMIQIDMGYWQPIAANAPFRHWKLDGNTNDTMGQNILQLNGCEWIMS